jgi:hypothetical protein
MRQRRGPSRVAAQRRSASLQDGRDHGAGESPAWRDPGRAASQLRSASPGTAGGRADRPRGKRLCVSGGHGQLLCALGIAPAAASPFPGSVRRRPVTVARRRSGSGRQRNRERQTVSRLSRRETVLSGSTAPAISSQSGKLLVSMRRRRGNRRLARHVSALGSARSAGPPILESRANAPAESSA